MELLKPEEQVRQWFISHLNQSGVESYRIATEYSVKIGGRNLRADIVVFELGKTTPIAIVECKAPTVAITAGTITQVSIYNAQIKARYMMVTNGTTTYIYDTVSKSYLTTLPCM